ncbi:Alginate biosynthesis sensor protein KinB [Tepidimonas thermarum]|uniref:histidine kinase n=1 Tax=Tepidimonas thermarum TaxID=335431 RepID=A0A554WXH7_9BURK|nr:ATP-binding protein [Tepidimonas thermarum]TSE28278.1 Alginate biosynthesis sensor protein KinB [Tepidimonas thermarum]
MSEAHTRDAQRARHLRWFLALALVFILGVGLVLFYLLALATDHRAVQPATYSRLLVLNLGVAAVLAGVLLWLAARLVVRLRRRRFGSWLLLKLAAIFGLVGVVPGALIYLVSYQFVNRAIETWFDARVETALRAGVELGRSALDTVSADWAAKTRSLAASLADSSDVAAGVVLERWREQLGASDVVLWSAQGRALASAGASRFRLAPDRPAPAQLRRVRVERVVTWIEGLEEAENLADPNALHDVPLAAQPRVQVLALVPARGVAFGAEPLYVQVVAPLPTGLVAHALAVQTANREYQERVLVRDGLRSMYLGTLTLALFLAVAGAVLLAVLLGNQLVRPLLLLAEGMRDVARGDLRPKVALPARDELAGLTRTFAHMTQELADARQAVQTSMRQVDAARASLQTLLDNLTTGVVVMTPEGRLRSANPGAARILGVALDAHLGQPLDAVPGLQAFGDWVHTQFAHFLADAEGHAPGAHWQQSYELATGAGPGPASVTRTLIARGALLPGGDRLLVLDDVSDLISAQRAQAWGEVARRLAHEIKNPLTPIQLSAERLALKLEPVLQGRELAMLQKSVKTIVDQVEAMKRLVNEFRDYARLPAAQPAPLDLGPLLREIVAMYEASPVPVRLELDPASPPVWADAQQLRQVVHNLVQNAQDATPAHPQASVTLRTRLSDNGQWVRLQVLDDGPGFPDAILQRAFEPYVTTKPKGTGLGLAVVKKIMDEHGGRVELANRREGDRIVGAQVSLSFRVVNMQQIQQGAPRQG